MELYENQDICLKCMSPLKGATRCSKCGFDLEKYQPMEHHLKPRTILHGQYIIGCVLGQGGFGITYVGWDLHLHMMVAVKEYFPVNLVMRDGSSNTVSVFSGSDEEFFRHDRSKFIREAQKLAKFDGDPGVVSVKNYFMENGTAYIVMEYIQGINLNVFIQQNGGKLSMQQTMKLLEQPILTLSQLHAENTFHRDISPENLMVTNNGRVKLIDFGSAMDYSMDQKTCTLKVRSGFSPIELYTTKGKESAYTDVYALCATIYKAITGVTPPISAERVTDDQLVPPSKLGVRGITPRQEKALMKGLAVNPASRFQSMEDLYNELKPAGQPKLNLPKPNFQKLNLPALLSNKKVLIAAAAALIVLIGVILAIALPGKPAGPALTDPTAEPTIEATIEPTSEPTAEPTAEPTPEATEAPTAEPTAEVPAPAAEAIVFSCPEFEAELRRALGREDDMPIYTSDLAAIEYLSISDNTIYINELIESDPGPWTEFPMDDLRFFTGLKGLKLGYHQGYAEVLNVLPALTQLEELYLVTHSGDGSIFTLDLSMLSGLEKLNYIWITGGNFPVIDFGAGIPNLESLMIGSTCFEYAQYGSMPNLKTLWLHAGSIRDLSSVASLTTLETLRVDPDISGGIDLSPIAALANLKSLVLTVHGEVDLTPVTGLTNLLSFYIANDVAVDIAPLEGMSGLKYLYLNVPFVNSAEILDGLQLEELNTYESVLNGAVSENATPVEFVSPEFEAMLRRALGYSDEQPIYNEQLESITSLLILRDEIRFTYDLDPNEYQNLAPDGGEALCLEDLKLFPNLSTLCLLLPNNTSDTLGPVAELQNLGLLKIAGDLFDDLSILTSPNLQNSVRDLYLAGAKITDLSLAAQLPNLEHIQIWHTGLTSLEPLRGHPTLWKAEVHSNPYLTDLSPFENLPEFGYGYNGEDYPT